LYSSNCHHSSRPHLSTSCSCTCCSCDMPEAAAACSCVLREQPGSAAGAERCNCRRNRKSPCYSLTIDHMPVAGMLIVRAMSMLYLCSSPWLLHAHGTSRWCRCVQ
jgi:hypothetical protein